MGKLQLRAMYALLALVAFAGGAYGQALQPVEWTFEVQQIGNNEYEVVCTADIERGWTVYSQHLDQNLGPVPTQLRITEDGLVLVGDAQEAGVKKEVFDPQVGREVVKYSNKMRCVQRVKVVDTDTTAVVGNLVYMTCDDEGCLPPQNLKFELPLQRGR